MTERQFSLFDARAFGAEAPSLRTPAAIADPDTSHAQARHLLRTGVLWRSLDATLDALRKANGVDAPTSRELAVAYALDRHEVARRLADALRLGLVTQEAARECRVGGRMAVTWRVVNL